MNNYKKEYFNDHCYFLIEENKDNVIVNYSVYETLSESKNTSDKKVFNKEKGKDIKKYIQKLLNSKRKISKKQVEKDFDSIENNGEIEELVDIDGTMLSSKIPYLNMYLHPKKTMDQTVVAARISNDPVTRGYRVYYGESENKEDEVINEVDFSDAFGYEETKDSDMKQTLKKLDDMGIKEPDDKLSRARQMGKRRDTKVVKNKKGEKIIKNLNLFEKETLEEIKKQKMIKMVEDMISKKEKDDSEVIKKDSPISKLLVKNLESIKKLAEKEGISLNKLINILKKGE